MSGRGTPEVRPPLVAGRRALLALLLVVGLLAAGCGSSEKSTSAEETTTSEVTTSGEVVEGTGYSYELPEGWTEADDQVDVEEIGSSDTVITADEPRGDLAVNVNVFREENIPESVNVDQYTKIGLDRVTSAPESVGLPAGTTVEVASGPEASSLAGEDATDTTLRTDLGSATLLQRQVSTLRDGVAYTITLTSNEDGLEEDSATLDALLASWSWG